jgi:hypothetical protein
LLLPSALLLEPLPVSSLLASAMCGLDSRYLAVKVQLLERKK